MNTDTFEGLRQQVADATLGPNLDDIHRLGRRRRAVRASLPVAAIVAVVMVIASGAVVATYFRDSQRPATTALRQTKPVAGPLAGVPVTLSSAMKIVAVYPLTTDLTYVFVQVEPGKFGIARTDDAGRHWSAWAFPAPPQNAAAAKFVALNTPIYLIGGSEAPVFVQSLTLTFGGYLTRDGGQSWTKVTHGQPLTELIPHSGARIGSDVATIPTGWRVDFLYLGKDLGNSSNVVAAIDPETGLWHKLAAQPGKNATSVRVTADGTIWATYGPLKPGKTTAPTDSGVAVSHDAGRSWTRTATASQVHGPVASIDSNDATVSVGPHPEDTNQFVTNDGGKTWRTEPGPKGFPYPAAELADGSYLGAIGPSSNVVRVTAGKVAVAPGTQGCNGLNVTLLDQYTTLVTATLSGSRVPSYKVSADGVHWANVAIPAALSR